MLLLRMNQNFLSLIHLRRLFHLLLPSSLLLNRLTSLFILIKSQMGLFLASSKNAVNKVQNAHSSLDDHLARWLGLNQSKYQWALDDYYETKGL
ncbi:hypothetical protein OIU79_012134, partial [Salix purpurea]